jgi:hypothetical protein
MKKITVTVLTFTFLAICLSACGTGTSSNNSSSSEVKPMPVGALMSEYKKSKEETVKKYTGKTLIVKGYASVPPIMPKGADDTGILTLNEKGGDMSLYLTCQFTQADKAGFEQIKGEQMVSITGTFDDSISTALKNCQVVKVD